MIKDSFRYSAIILISTVISAFFPLISSALEDPGTQLNDVGLTTKLGTKIDLSTRFTDSDGKSVALRDLIIPQRPTIIIPAYYDCPRLCGLVQSGVANLLNGLKLKLGSDYTVITFSFDVTATLTQAKEFGSKYTDLLQRPDLDRSAWHFLIGPQTSIDPLMQSLGFNVRKDGEEYAHTAAIFIVTPNGEISQYLAGVNFDPVQARYALVEASQGNIGNVLDQAFLFCFRYDHIKGKYVWAAFGAMRLGGILTLSFLSFLIYRLWYGERRLSS